MAGSTASLLAAADLTGMTKQARPARMLRQPCLQRLLQQRRDGGTAGRPPTLDPFAFADEDGAAFEVDVGDLHANEFAASGSGMGGHANQRENPRMARMLLGVGEQLSDFASTQIEGFPKLF